MNTDDSWSNEISRGVNIVGRSVYITPDESVEDGMRTQAGRVGCTGWLAALGLPELCHQGSDEGEGGPGREVLMVMGWSQGCLHDDILLIF